MSAGTGAGLAVLLRAGARGLYPAEAAVELLIESGQWLHRGDFRRYVAYADDGSLAVVDWSAALAGLDGGDLPASGGEARLLRLAASLGGGCPVALADALSGLDSSRITAVVGAVWHANGRHPGGDRR